MSQRWWLKPGERLWYGSGELRDWQAWFLWDDLGGTWGIAVNGPGENVREPNAWWHYDVGSLDLGREMPQAARAALMESLHERTPPQELDPIQKHVLDAIAAETVTTTQNKMSGRKLRQEMGARAPEAMRALKRLVPRFVGVTSGSPEEGDDEYAATLIGLLQSEQAPVVSDALEHVLVTLKTMYQRDANLLLYAWKDLADDQWQAYRVLFEVVIEAAALSDWHSKDQWRVPKDIEEVQALGDVSAFLAWVPNGRKERAWRSAPRKLPSDEAPLVLTEPPVGSSVADGAVDRMRHVFYSWQSDLPGRGNRNLISDALRKATEAIAKDQTVDIEPVVDRDTAGLSGSPDIKTAIFDKIERASVFVADVSIIGEVPGQNGKGPRAVPNPNVLIELGYAVRVHGWSRIVLIANDAYGAIDRLPFDLRGHRVMSYSATAGGEDIPEVRKGLSRDLERALRAILEIPGDD